MAARKTRKNSRKQAGSAAKKAEKVKTTAGKTSSRTKAKPKPAPERKKAAVKKVSVKAPAKRKQKTVPRTKKPVRALTPRPGSKEFEDERRVALRRLLISRREQIVKEAKAEISKYIKGETRQLVDTALDDGDWSVVDLSEDVSLRRLGTHRENLQRIDEALRKFDEGTYGICEDCGEEISRERLKILPFAIYCTDCQERREQLEEIEKRES